MPSPKKKKITEPIQETISVKDFFRELTGGAVEISVKKEQPVDILQEIESKIDYLDEAASQLSTRSHTKVILAILRLMLAELENNRG